jgi:hypothetical protein
MRSSRANRASARTDVRGYVVVLRTEVRVPTIHSRVQPAAVLSVAATPARGQFVNAPDSQSGPSSCLHPRGNCAEVGKP